MRHRILVARRVPQAVADRARRDFDAVVAEQDMDLATALRVMAEQRSEGLLTGPKLRLTAESVAELPPSLRIVANATAGTDHMDVAATKARGIAVTHAAGALTACTADLAMLLLLGACRRAGEYGAIMRAGWRRPIGFDAMLGQRIGGRRLGIVGMGRIGRAVAARARAFGMTILYHNRHRLDPALEQGATFCRTLEEMLPQAEVLSLHLPGGEAGTLMTAARFALLPPGAVFVNTARGSLVDEEALIAALREGRLFAAGLDVFRREPDFDLRFNELPNVVLTPHVASATVETRDAMGFQALDNIAAVLAGHPPLDPV